jgi:hypothetical protein
MSIWAGFAGRISAGFSSSGLAVEGQGHQPEHQPGLHNFCARASMSRNDKIHAEPLMPWFGGSLEQGCIYGLSDSVGDQVLFTETLWLMDARSNYGPPLKLRAAASVAAALAAAAMRCLRHFRCRLAQVQPSRETHAFTQAFRSMCLPPLPQSPSQPSHDVELQVQLTDGYRTRTAASAATEQPALAPSQPP